MEYVLYIYTAQRSVKGINHGLYYFLETMFFSDQPQTSVNHNTNCLLDYIPCATSVNIPVSGKIYGCSDTTMTMTGAFVDGEER